MRSSFLACLALAGCHLVSGLTEFELGDGGSNASGGSSATGGGGSAGSAGVGGNGVAGGELLWATSFASSDHERGRGVAMAPGEVVVTAAFFGALELDMPGQVVSSAGGTQDAALIRLDPGSGAVTGQPTSVGGVGSELPRAVAVGPDGSTYLCGSYQDTFTFAGSTTPDPGTDVDAGFVAAWGSTGAPRWVRTFLSPGQLFARCHGVAVDETGVYVVGYFTDDLDWAGSDQSANGKSGFVAKLGADGTALDVAVLDASGGDVDLHSIALAGSGRPVICGELGGSVSGDFDLGFVGDGLDMLVVQLDSALSPVWQRVVGGTGDQVGEWLSANDAGEVVVGAIYGETLSVGVDNVAVESDEAAVIGFDAQGDVRWARTFVGTGNDRMRSVFLDDAGQTFLALGFEETLSFDGRNATAQETDVLLARLDAEGNVAWHVQLGGPGFDTPWGIAEHDGVVVATGEYREPVTIMNVPLKSGPSSNWWVAAFSR
ncbi:MAG TPA: hypothetical protein ENK57_07000 [Polyangiaceae bacterium]|nr:hypothetical protein [Polyangiaceae bacterium]